VLLNTKYRRLFSEEIVERSEYPQITAPMLRYLGDLGGEDLTFDWSCITKPFVMGNGPRKNGFDQFMVFGGSNIDDLTEFQAEVEVSLGVEGTKKRITGPRLLYIPRGLTFGPIEFKSVSKPIFLMNFYLTPKYSKRWVESDYDKYIKEMRYLNNTYELKSVLNGMPFREFAAHDNQMLVMCDDVGIDGANFCFFYYVKQEPHLLTEPTHAHSHDMWLININADPLHVDRFDGEIEMWWGKEDEKQVIDSTSVAHVIPGLKHRSINYARVRRPFIQIHVYNQPTPFKDEITDEEGGFSLAPGRQR
jgi:hypothetical protein